MDTEKRRAKMLELRENKVSLGDIGKMFGISRQRVSQICGNTGRIAKQPAPIKSLVLSYRGRYRDGGISAKEISMATGVSLNTIKHSFYGAGVKKLYTDRSGLLDRGMGRCYNCHRVKPLASMTKDKSAPYGYGRCKACGRNQTRKRYRARTVA